MSHADMESSMTRKQKINFIFMFITNDVHHQYHYHHHLWEYDSHNRCSLKASVPKQGRCGHHLVLVSPLMGAEYEGNHASFRSLSSYVSKIVTDKNYLKKFLKD